MSAIKDTLLKAEENNPEISLAEKQVDNGNADFDAQVATIPMEQIDLSFHNTRKKIPQSEIDSLKASIQSIGLISAITVKPKENGRYELIAGFKRHEAKRQLEHSHVNAILLDANASEAHTTEANLAENFNRSGLSLANQCTAVKRLVTVLEGDESTKSEIIALRLNMTPKQVKDRLILAALIDDAMNAFDDGKLPLKTAILLATLTDEQQAKYLVNLLTGKMNHADLLEAVGKATVTLSLAKFSVADCQQCPHNSEVQGSLFADTNSNAMGTCNNITCFKSKSKAWFENHLAELEGEFGTVIRVTEVESTLISSITAEQLGDEQISQCASCADNISLVQNKPNEKFGDVINNVCRNKNCFNTCASKFAEAQATATGDTKDGKLHNTSTDSAEVKNGKNKTCSERKGTPPVKAKETTATAKLSKAGVESARVATAKIQINKGLGEAIDSKMLMFLAVMRLTGDMMGYEFKNIADVVNMDDGTLRNTINSALLTYLAKGEKESGESKDSYPVGNILLTLLSAKGQLQDAITQSWTIAELKHNTKAGIKQILTESGFKAHLEAKEKGAFNKLMSEKVPEIHKVLAATDFDFSQYAPKAYIEAVEKVANSIT